LESFYVAALHELTHLTGHTTRLARNFGGCFGDESYAFEELIAELGASFVCAELGMVPATHPE
jgi:antirestriction protein ArdC